ncbi:MAG: DUF4136 domain-containing protein [Sphingopyxis sp.]|nr:DUF4136 domain-containing protein [Sphingopyxis sp.]
MNCRLVPFGFAILAAPLVLLTGCATTVPPVEVTRFHTSALAALAPGAAYRIADDAAALGEAHSYRTAVDVEMRKQGFVPAAVDSAAPLLVRISLTRSERRGDGASPVSVGVGGSTGSYGSGVGVGIGLNLGGGPRRWVDLTLGVRIDDAATGTALWEGRAATAIPVKAPAAQPSLAAAKLAAALFGGFPGESGTTISVP